MARSKKCLSCKYCGRVSGMAEDDIKNDYTCDYLIMTGKMPIKGEDKDNCLLYESKQGNRRKQLSLIGSLSNYKSKEQNNKVWEKY